jgi:hypothetical protein
MLIGLLGLLAERGAVFPFLRYALRCAASARHISEKTESQISGSDFREALIDRLQESAKMALPKERRRIGEMVLWLRGKLRG